ncbi:hypothetical protein DSO57_1012021 [Entomophthora muscae]|uniref:Uncharacterized protein n=1 Tax=Entomophthora muscae TaxID=34485 RepID=A0ACC2URL8_9FUNG|nr:hypothetical protein DSO57_1012021 [Entomophthora muscae]
MAIVSFCLFSLGLLFITLYLTSDGLEGVGADYTGIIRHPERTLLDPGNLWIPKLPLNSATFPAVTFNTRTGCRFSDARGYVWCLNIRKADMFLSNNAKYRLNRYTTASQCGRFDILRCSHVDVAKMHIDPTDIMEPAYQYLEPSAIPVYSPDKILISGTANSTKLLFIRLVCRLTCTNVATHRSQNLAWDLTIFIPVVNCGTHQKVTQI